MTTVERVSFARIVLRKSLFLLTAAAALGAGGGCEKEEAIAFYNAPKDPTPVATSAAAAATRKRLFLSTILASETRCTVVIL